MLDARFIALQAADERFPSGSFGKSDEGAMTFPRRLPVARGDALRAWRSFQHGTDLHSRPFATAAWCASAPSPTP